MPSLLTQQVYKWALVNSMLGVCLCVCGGSGGVAGGVLWIFLGRHGAAGTLIPLPYTRPCSAPFCDPILDYIVDAKNLYPNSDVF